MATEHRPAPPSDVDGPQRAGLPIGPLHELEASGHFVRDSSWGRILHPGRGKISYRQAVSTNSLHVVIDGHRVSAHIDSQSPLTLDESRTRRHADRRARYSVRRTVSHTLASIVDAVRALASGQRTASHGRFYCERVEVSANKPSGPSEPPHRGHRTRGESPGRPSA